MTITNILIKFIAALININKFRVSLNVSISNNGAKKNSHNLQICG